MKCRKCSISVQTLAVLVSEELNMKKPPTTSIVRRASVTMPMDTETFKELFGGLPFNFNIPRAQVLPNSYRALNQAQRSLCTHGRACIS